MSAPEYGDYAKDRTSWFFGLTGPQLALVVLAGLPDLIALNSHAWPLFAGWLPVWGLLVVLVAVPVRGRPAARWLLDLASFAPGRVMGWTSWQSKAAAGTVQDLDEADLPGVLAAVRIHDGPPFGPTLVRLSIVQNTAERTWAAVARIAHPGIGLAEAEERSRMGAGLAELHEIASRTELIDMVAIQVRTVPDDGAARSAPKRSSPSSSARTGSPSPPRNPAAASTAGPGCCMGRSARWRTGCVERSAAPPSPGWTPRRWRSRSAPGSRPATGPRSWPPSAPPATARALPPACRWPPPGRPPPTPRSGTTTTTPGPASLTPSCCPTGARSSARLLRCSCRPRRASAGR